MSKSYKRAIFQCDGAYKRYAKRQANKRVRRSAGVPDGGGYKKIYCSWDISDYIVDSRYSSGEWVPKGAIKTRNGWMVPK